MAEPLSSCQISDSDSRSDSDEKVSSKPAFIALNPYDDESWFLLDRDGFCSWSFNNMKQEQADPIRKIMLGYEQRRAKRTGSTFTKVFTRGGNDTKVLVTPQTKWDEPKRWRESVNSFADRGLGME